VTRRALAAVALLSSVATALSAQVGHTPQASPYQDLRGTQSVTLSIGSIAPGRDPAGVAPGSGLLLTARHDLRMTGPLWLTSRVAYAPGLTRQMKDPLLTGAARNVGESTRPLTIVETGLLFNITGNKAWKRLAPHVHLDLGMALGGTNRFDVGGYRFGNKFVFSYGAGTRIATGSAWEVQVDLTQSLWQYKYPQEYGGDGSVDDESILGRGGLSAWVGNTRLSVGLSRAFFR